MEAVEYFAKQNYYSRYIFPVGKWMFFETYHFIKFGWELAFTAREGALVASDIIVTVHVLLQICFLREWNHAAWHSAFERLLSCVGAEMVHKVCPLLKISKCSTWLFFLLALRVVTFQQKWEPIGLGILKFEASVFVKLRDTLHAFCLRVLFIVAIALVNVHGC